MAICGGYDVAPALERADARTGRKYKLGLVGCFNELWGTKYEKDKAREGACACVSS